MEGRGSSGGWIGAEGEVWQGRLDERRRGVEGGW